MKHYTLRASIYGGIDVIEWDTWPDGSTLAGQPRKTYVSNYESPAAAMAAHPQATQFSNVWSEPQVSLRHLNPDGDLGGKDGYGDPDEYSDN